MPHFLSKTAGAFLALATALLPIVPSQAQDTTYILRGKDVACLIENHATYLAIARDLFFISLDDCPNTDRLDAGSFARNLAATPSFDQREAAHDNLITLTRAHLTCLGTLSQPAAGALYAFAPDSCALTPADESTTPND